MTQHAVLKAQILSEAVPYMQEYHDKIVVVKYGGNAMVNEVLIDNVINDVCLMNLVGIHVILVHGGGPEINNALKRAHKESKFINGLRYTDEDIEKQKSGYWDSESLDFPIYFNPADNEGYVDDGQLNIIMLGDETVGNVEDSSSLAYKVKEITGGNVMSAQYEGMTFSISEKTYNIPEDAFSTYYFVTCLINNDFYLAENALNSMSDDIKQKYSDFLYWARYLDYSTADVIVLCAGRNDYLQGRPLEGEDKYSEQPFGTPNSISGGLDLTIRMLKSTYPNAQIIVCSPSFFLTEDEDGKLVGADIKNNGYGGVGEYVVNMAGVASDESVTFVDNYFGIKFNASNYEEYIDENGNPNDKANQLIAEHLTNYFYYNLKKGAK